MRALATAVLAKLNTDAADIGDGQPPKGFTYPYGIMWTLGESDREGDMSDWDVTGWWRYQVTTVGETPDQARLLSDRLRGVMEAASLTVSGYTVGPIRRDVTGLVERDDDVQPPVWFCGDIFEIFVAPS